MKPAVLWVFLKENILPRGPQASVLLLDELDYSFGTMETQQQQGLLEGEQGRSEGNQGPAVLLRLDITSYSHSSPCAERRKVYTPMGL